MLRGNKIYKIDKNGKKHRIFTLRGLKGIRIKFKGHNSTVVLKEPFAKFKNCRILCNDNCYAEIGGSSHRLVGLRISMLVPNSTCIIGEEFSTDSNCHILISAEANHKITIGNDCMFAAGTVLRTSDAHSILDETGKIYNYASDITIGNHVWLGYRSIVLKGVTIPDNCAVGCGSIVTASPKEANAIYAGVPAKMIRSNILWKREAPKTEAELLKKNSENL